MSRTRQARFAIGQVVRHRIFPFRGVIFDVDPQFANTEEWYESIPSEMRPHKDQPFYHLLAENAETEYIAYVSEQNLLPDEKGGSRPPFVCLKCRRDYSAAGAGAGVAAPPCTARSCSSRRRRLNSSVFRLTKSCSWRWRFSMSDCCNGAPS
jgi:heat shock protein HspQ